MLSTGGSGDSGRRFKQKKEEFEKAFKVRTEVVVNRVVADMENEDIGLHTAYTHQGPLSLRMGVSERRCCR